MTKAHGSDPAVQQKAFGPDKYSREKKVELIEDKEKKNLVGVVVKGEGRLAGKTVGLPVYSMTLRCVRC